MSVSAAIILSHVEVVSSQENHSRNSSPLGQFSNIFCRRPTLEPRTSTTASKACWLRCRIAHCGHRVADTWWRWPQDKGLPSGRPLCLALTPFRIPIPPVLLCLLWVQVCHVSNTTWVGCHPSKSGGGQLQRRQDFPEKAFYLSTGDQLAQVHSMHKKYFFIAQSYRWLSWGTWGGSSKVALQLMSNLFFIRPTHVP